MSEMVWMARARHGLAFHAVSDGTRKTICGRFFGDVVDGEPQRGLLLAEAEAVADFSAPRCVRCYEPDSAVQPRITRRAGGGGS
jgi:hypothetical protein